MRKHLTEEKGWVPAQYLMDEANYTLYLQKKLNEKIDKLPVFESKKILIITNDFFHTCTYSKRIFAQTIETY